MAQSHPQKAVSWEQGRGPSWDKALANASPGMGLLWGPGCRSEIKTKVLLLLLCLPGGEQEPGMGYDTRLIKPEQNGCEQPFRAQGPRMDSGK